MHLDELVVQSRVGYRCEMKNGIELFVAELIVPIERCQILRNKVATVAGEILKSPERKSSITVSRESGNFSCNASVRLEPINPAPPVMTKLAGSLVEGTGNLLRVD